MSIIIFHLVIVLCGVYHFSLLHSDASFFIPVALVSSLGCRGISCHLGFDFGFDLGHFSVFYRLGIVGLPG